MQKNNHLRKVTVPIITVLLILLYFTGCTQPIQEVPGTAPEKDGFSLNFNYSMTGAFDRAVTRASELNRAKMYITNLVTGKTETHDWIVLIDKETLEAKSYSSVALNMGKYSFELVVSRGSYNYYAKSGPIELKNGANNIPLKLTPVIGDFISSTATVTDLSCISNLVYKFSTAQLAMVNDPRLGYSINGLDEIIIKLNKTTGLAPVKVCLPDGTYPIELKFYDGTTLLGTNLKTKKLSISTAFTSSTIDLYPLYGDCSFDISSGTGEANFALKLSKELSDKLKERYGLIVMADLRANITIQYEDHFVKAQLPFKWDSSSSNYITSGVIKGLTYGKANLIVDLVGVAPAGYMAKEPVSTSAARSITENLTIGEAGAKLDIVYRLFPPNKVESSLKSIVNLSLLTVEGNTVTNLALLADGKSFSGSDIKRGKNSIQLTLDSDTKLLEVKEIESGKTVATFDLSLKPFEVKNITHSFSTSSLWSIAPPFQQTIKVGSNLLRVHQVGFGTSRRLEVEKLNSSGTGWVKAAPDYPLAADESYSYSKKNWAIDSKGRLYLTISTPLHLNNHKIIRLSENLNHWQDLTAGLTGEYINVFSDKIGNIYTLKESRNKKIFMKKLKADDSGWEDYPLPALPKLPQDPYFSEYGTMRDFFTDKEGNFYTVVNNCNPEDLNLFFYKYSSKSGKWQFLFNIKSLYGSHLATVKYCIDENSNIYSVQQYGSLSHWTTPWGSESEYKAKMFVGKYDSQRGQFNNLEIKSLKDPAFGSLNIKAYKSEVYITGSQSANITPYLAKVNVESGIIDETLAQDSPVIADGFAAETVIAEDGTILLRYHNYKTAQSYYYKKR